MILSAVKHFNWDIKKAADVLGVTDKTIYNKLYRYGIYHTKRKVMRGHR